MRREHVSQKVKMKIPIKKYEWCNSIGFKIQLITEKIICKNIAFYLFQDMLLQETEKQFHIYELANRIVNQQGLKTLSLGLKIEMQKGNST